MKSMDLQNSIENHDLLFSHTEVAGFIFPSPAAGARRAGQEVDRVRALLVLGYATLSLPYMYRAVDTGLRTIDVRTLTEAAQILGAGWTTIIARVILPNVLIAVLSGAFL